MVQIDKVYTRGGDHGQTSLGDGSRVSKQSPRIRASGTVDEINCCLGLAAAAMKESEPLRASVLMLQQFLFDLGADLCVPFASSATSDETGRRISTHHVQAIEALIDEMSEALQPLKSFILPGGTPAAAALHQARAVCRRAELDVLAANEATPFNPQVLIALNRLSDLLFVMARVANDNGATDILWEPGRALPQVPDAS